MSDPADRARAVWATWCESVKDEWGFEREVANYLDAEDKGLIDAIAAALRAERAAVWQEAATFVEESAPRSREDVGGGNLGVLSRVLHDIAAALRAKGEG